MQPLKQLLGFTKGMKRIFLIIAATSVAGAALSLVQPFIIKFATDWVTAILGHRAEFSWGMILLLGALVLASALISAVITDVGGYFGDQMAVRVRFQLSTKYFVIC
jgi:ATP-binding cassette subfamily B protein